VAQTNADYLNQAQTRFSEFDGPVMTLDGF
jgi:hypothetical protein